MVQFSHPYMTTGKTIALTIWTFVGKVMSLFFNMLFRFVIAFLPRSKHIFNIWSILNYSWEDYQRKLRLQFVLYNLSFHWVIQALSPQQGCDPWRGYAEYIIQNAGLDESQPGINTAGRNIHNLRYAVDNIILTVESEKELESLLRRV